MAQVPILKWKWSWLLYKLEATFQFNNAWMNTNKFHKSMKPRLISEKCFNLRNFEILLSHFDRCFPSHHEQYSYQIVASIHGSHHNNSQSKNQ